MRVIAVHLLNDRSGSPLVFRHALQTLAAAGARIDLLTATPGPAGFLSNLPEARLHSLPYRRFSNPLLTLLAFCWTQLAIFWRVLRLADRGAVVYINTLLPAGAALAGWLRGAQVVYHLHEVSVRPAVLRRILLWVVARTATRVLHVSDYLRTALALPVACQEVVYNTLDAAFCASADEAPAPAAHFTVLMACSLRDYKGVPEFFALAHALPSMRFELVINASLVEVTHYCAAHAVPANLTLFPAARDMHSHYRRAAVVVNLSRPDEWIETFGMTVLEALRYGRPVIVPPVGGVAEVNMEGETGYAINGRNLPALVNALRELSTNPAHYARMATAGRLRAARFAPEQFAYEVRRCFAELSTTQDLLAAHHLQTVTG